MGIYEIIILSVALALDAMLVSFSYGLIVKSKKLLNALNLSVSFGFFQFIMPVIGWHLTGFIYDYIKIYSKWIVFGVFMWLGLKFLKEGYSNENKDIQEKCISFSCIICLALATSIDAFGAGVSIRFTNTEIMLPSVIIGIITFLLSCFGFFSAGIFCKLPPKYISTAGAVLLIYLAVKSL
ncbi:MAG: manganese efflux pump MntP family protein [Candidatus Gastranaerophilales bacterium]|nr:manganese efflux pump MntP family protein [Candidatus Gastranaerophilales bacterium]